MEIVPWGLPLNPQTSFWNNIVNAFKSLFTTASTLAPRRVDPFILDLDNDGIETIKVATGVNFDMDHNGFSEQSGWVNPDDGLLALDRDGDGLITDGTELFGDQTILQNGSRAANGFQALAEWDANADDRIDANDAIWSSLKVWRDVNSDGVSSADELFTLDQLGIASIGLTATSTNLTDANGNTMTQSGSFTKVDGSTGQTGNYLFSRNTTFSTATDWLPETADIAGLPDLQGYGTTYTLHQAMLRDASGTLKGLVEAFAAATDEATRKSLMDQIIYAWTNSSSIDPASRGTQIDARKLHALEMLFGQAFWGASGANPNSVAAPLLNQSYQGMYDTFYAQLMAQTNLKQLYDQITYVWDENSQSLKGDLTSVIADLEGRLALDPVAGLATFTDFTRNLDTLKVVGMMSFDSYKSAFMSKGEDFSWVLESVGMNIVNGTTTSDSLYVFSNNNAINGYAGNDNISGGIGNDVLYGNAGNDTLNGGSGIDILRGGANDDTLNGGSGNDLLYGDTGIDSLLGGIGSDVLDGGVGNDTLQGGQGDDIYIYRAGSGNDSITSYEGVGLNGIDAVVLEGLNQSDIDYRQSSNNLILKIKSSGETLTLTNWFIGADNQVESFQFADGTVVGGAAIAQLATVVGTEAGETLYGSNYNNDVMYGLGGVDSMSGYNGNDIIDGGAGNDTLNGGNDNDTLRGGADNDTLNGDAGNDLLYGDDGIDSLLGGTGSDVLDGGVGNDTMQGGQGDDTYIYRAGSGNDSITSYEGVGLNGIDAVVLEGLNQSDIDYRQSSNNLILKIKSSGETLTLTNWFIGADNQVESFQFADGTVVGGAAIAQLATVVGTEVGDTLYGSNYNNDVMYGLGGIDSMSGYNGNDTMDGGAGNDTLNGGNDNDTLRGGADNDTLNGDAGNDLLYGDDGIDSLLGGTGSDVLDGGVGNDTLQGGQGDDTYIYRAGSGNDSITSYEGVGLNGIDAVVLEGLNQSDIDYRQSSNNLILKIKSSGETLTLTNWFTGADYQVESFQFADGTVVGGAAIAQLATVVGTEVGDTLYGSNYNNDVMYGLGGVDSMSGYNGNDIIDGGAGNDTLNGGNGNDTYMLGRGGGSDTINENDATVGNIDTAQFQSEIATDQLWFRKVNTYDLEVSVIGTSDKFTVKSWYSGNQYHVEQFKTNDGKVLLDTQVANLVNAMAAFTPPSVGQTTLPQNYQTTLAPVIAANWH